MLSEKEKKHNRLMSFRKYYENNKNKVLNGHLLRNYGISLKKRNNLLKKQENKCKICKIEFLEKQRVCVDHDHETGVVRGLLCNSCNIALGLFKDNIEILESAQRYLNGS